MNNGNLISANSENNKIDLDGYFLESNSGWGIFIPNQEDVVYLKCPSAFVEDGKVSDDYFVVNKSADKNYINQFKLRLEDYVALEKDITSISENDLISKIIDSITLAGACYLAYQVAWSAIDKIHAQPLIEEINELQDDMTFFYTELFRERN